MNECETLLNKNLYTYIFMNVFKVLLQFLVFIHGIVSFVSSKRLQRNDSKIKKNDAT